MHFVATIVKLKQDCSRDEKLTEAQKGHCLYEINLFDLEIEANLEKKRSFDLEIEQTFLF